MKTRFDKKGVTLIELLVALVISGIIIAAIYRMFVAQTRAYTVQDQVSDVQQNVRNAMERIARDLMMAGFDDDNRNASGVDIPLPAVIEVFPTDAKGFDSVRVYYETNFTVREVRYWVNASNQLVRTQNPADPGSEAGGDPILDNVTRFSLAYGVDYDPVLLVSYDDRRLHGWVGFADTAGRHIVAVRVQLRAGPASANPDVNTQVSPRGFDTVVTLRNQLTSK